MVLSVVWNSRTSVLVAMLVIVRSSCIIRAPSITTPISRRSALAGISAPGVMPLSGGFFVMAIVFSLGIWRCSKYLLHKSRAPRGVLAGWIPCLSTDVVVIFGMPSLASGRPGLVLVLGAVS